VAASCVDALLRPDTHPIYVQRFQAFDSSQPIVNGATWTTTQRGYDSDSSKRHGRTDSRSCLRFVERDQPSHWPNSVNDRSHQLIVINIFDQYKENATGTGFTIM
jgi:hypothetical protein